MQQEDILKALREERDELESELKALDSVISRFERRVVPVQTVIQNNKKPSLVNSAPLFTSEESIPANAGRDKNFPKDANVEQQVLYVISNSNRAQRYPELQHEYTKLSGLKRNIRQYLTDLRQAGTVVAIKYNNNSLQVYQGLPEWVTDTDTGPVFKDEFIDLDKKNFPTGVWKSVRLEKDKA